MLRKKKIIKKLRAYPKRVIGGLLLLLVLGYGLVTIFAGLPSPGQLGSDTFPVSTKILDRNGQLLYEIYTDQNRTPVKISDLPEYVKEATIAIEDKNFYKHHGFAWEGITRAILNTVFKRNLQGGSTITQQLVKTTLLTPERTFKRKIREALLALATEIRYSKDEILELYLNHVPYGGTAYGVEQAAHTYFDKNAKDLSLAEAALLAGLPQAPTRYSPFGANPETAKERQAQVLQRMLEDKYINQDEYQQALDEPLSFAPQTNNIRAPHFSLYIKQLLVDKYGEALVEKGGLRVTTSLDLDLQNFAQDTVATEVGKLNQAKVSNGAALITKPRTGEILAMVGSQDYFDLSIDGNVNVTTRLRQPGSSIKPINYAAGLGNGYTPATMFLDVPVCFSVPGQPSYCPRNYDYKFHGPVQMRFALGNSFNIPAVKMLAANGVETMIATASAMGITTFTDPSRYGLSLTLGGGEVYMTDMAVAFGVFANAGLKVELTPILKVETYQGKVLEEINFEESLPAGEKVVSPEITYLISHILLDNNARSQAFGSGSQLVIPGHAVSVKTGTTDDLRDNWTIGFTPSFLVATWVGNNDNQPMSPYLVSGISGAAPIWHKIMVETLKDQPDEWPTKPENVVGLEVCSLTGFRPRPDEPCATRFEYFIKGSEPKEEPVLKQGIVIDKTTGLPPRPNASPNPDDLEVQEHLVLFDPVQKDYCLDCARPLNDKGEPQEPAYNIKI
ncbi:MAG: PBP1A family penicillin-binding protein [Patescibacteria group bacterium]|nr:PBP1A family penicillin-binding protein [Candidatus Beckwithbacteria bacterium]MDZ4228735.1 PBP1A family penicillin-binding protein [Patescibacteria group bacterium]